MAKCYLCEDEAVVSCSSCLKPICRVHQTSSAGTISPDQRIVCLPCAKDLKKRRITFYTCFCSFVAIVMLVVVLSVS